MTTGGDMDELRLLFVLRHAKAAWSDGADHERPLAPRGLEDAPHAGRWLREHSYLPDLVVCSTARRTRETWQLVAGELSAQPAVEYDDDLYGADVEEFLRVARRTPAEVTRLALVGHEPGVSDLTLHLDQEAGVSAFPAGAVAVLAVSGDWGGLDGGSARLVDFFRPRDAG
jgi:phosphohistidine phosphatase